MSSLGFGFVIASFLAVPEQNIKGEDPKKQRAIAIIFFKKPLLILMPTICYFNTIYMICQQ